MNLSDLVKGILTGNIQKDTLSKQQLEDVINTIELMKAALSPEQQKKNKDKAIAEGNKRAFRDANIKEPKKQDSEPVKNESPRKTNHLTVIKEEGCLAKADEAMNWSENGQWSLEKAIKEGPTLNYGKIDPERNPMSNPQAAKEAKAKRYADADAKAPIIDYGSNPAAKPKYYTGAADRAKAVQAKLEAESKETALETMARRGQIKPAGAATTNPAPIIPAGAPAPVAGTLKPTKKSDGVNIEEEPSAAARSRMTAKNDMSQSTGSLANTMTMSEKEPHEDDPEHEEKEKKKAKKIKELAEGISDLHKSLKKID